jgi:DNA-binding beta-propeller fold protein YncE
MKKVLHIVTNLLLLFLVTGCGKIVAPEIVRYANDGSKFWVTNRANKELLSFDGKNGKILGKQTFPSAINDLLLDNKGRLWVVCEGQGGILYELNPSNHSILSGTSLGYEPSALAYNEKSGTLWVTQRFNNELWEIDPVSKKVLSQISVGREPVDVISVSRGDYMLVVNNLPSMASTDFPVATHIDVVDVAGKKITNRIMLTNGATDARAITSSHDGKYSYVTHLVGRYQLPTNQVDRGWMSTNAISIINNDDFTLETTVLLDTPQRGAANPSSIEISPDGQYIVISLSGSHELCVIAHAALHERLEAVKQGEKVIPSVRKWEDIPNDAGFLYGIRDFISTGGKGPRGFAFHPDGSVAVANYFSAGISMINSQSKVSRSYKLGVPLTSTKRGLGEMYFNDATLCFQQWQSCTSCHPNGARIDGLNWDLLNDGAGNPKNTKSLLYSHQTPPVMITGIRKNAEAAVRSGLKFIHFADAPDEVAQAMDEYLKNLTPLPSPYLIDGKLSESAERGKVNFDKYCAYCHSGKHYTDMKLYMVDWAAPKDNVPMDVPTLVEIWRTAPYLYDGRSYTMREMLDVHGPEDKLSSKELDELAEYVLSL